MGSDQWELVLPLLHVSAARSFQEAQSFVDGGSLPTNPCHSDSYFEYAGRRIGELLCDHCCGLPIWLDPPSG